MFYNLASRILRLRDFVFDLSYRKALLSRVVLFFLRKLNSDIAYVGLNVNGEKTFLFTSDKAVTPYALATGGFQKQDFLHVIGLLEQEGALRRGGVFLDIGANIGTQTIYALHSKLFKKSYCFEPVQANLELLRVNLFANNLLNQTTIVPMALSDREGESQIALSSVNCGDHRVVAKNASNNIDRKLETIRCTTLDNYMAAESVGPNEVALVWMDTQGHEAQVLNGARKLLQNNIPLVMEFWPWALRNANGYDQILEFIRNDFHYFYDLHFKQSKKVETRFFAEYAEKLRKIERYSTDLLLMK